MITPSAGVTGTGLSNYRIGERNPGAGAAWRVGVVGMSASTATRTVLPSTISVGAEPRSLTRGGPPWREGLAARVWLHGSAPTG
jgi:hypothetical protein